MNEIEGGRKRREKCTYHGEPSVSPQADAAMMVDGLREGGPKI